MKEEFSSLLVWKTLLKGFFCYIWIGYISPIWYVVGQAIQPLKRRRKVSSANAESEPPYKKPSPYL